MDIASFVLGMCSVVVTSVFVFTVNALIKMKREMKEFNNNIDVLRSSIDAVVNEYRDADAEINVLMNERFDEMHRILDARFDKVYSRISNG
jgi:biopolymer transport protein ExbB/TolQ